MGSAMRSSETDEDVRSNLAPSMIPLFNRVRQGIHSDRYMTRTEAFLEYVKDHPSEEIEAIDRIADLRLTSVLRPMLDFYETPSWAVRAIAPVLPVHSDTRILDPGCGTGAIMRELGTLFPNNAISGIEKDRNRYEAALMNVDLPIDHGDFFHHHEHYDLIVSNPPYSHALEFVQHAQTLAPIVCMLLRLPWLASQHRAEWHRENPCHVNVLPRRPSFTADGKTDATEYMWAIWGTENASRYNILHVEKRQKEDRSRCIR